MTDIEKVRSITRRVFLERAGTSALVVAGGVAAATVAQQGTAEASPGSPALYFNSFGYAPAGQSTLDLATGIYGRFSETSGFYDVRKGSSWVGIRTANTQGFVEFIGFYPNTVAVVVSAGDDSYSVLNQMVYIIQHTYWL